MAAKKTRKQIKVAELFAGVGGFRVGLERVSKDFVTVFSSQWEPPGTPSKQFASRCYVARFGPEGHSNEDIAKVLDEVEQKKRKLPDIDMVVGGFPCQDYSVAKPLNQSVGLQGKKGVLWWEIHRLLRLLKERKRPAQWVFLENVDRLIKSPANQRGRDFAIMLASLCDLGYEVEWRVVNAAEYGFPQKRRRVFIVARRNSSERRDGTTMIFRTGVLARAFPVESPDSGEHLSLSEFELRGALDEISQDFGRGVERTRFENAGFASRRRVWTAAVEPDYRGRRTSLGDVLLRNQAALAGLEITQDSRAKWEYLKGSKDEPRIDKKTGFEYRYTEGRMDFPDSLSRASRTILTSEGGASPSRSKHVVHDWFGNLRRLHPVELERLNGFPDDWTNTGMSPIQRAFCMGNALVVGLVAEAAAVIARDEKLAQAEPVRPVTTPLRFAGRARK